MRIANLLAIAFVSMCLSSYAQSAELDGKWLGYEPRSSLSPDEKETKWFYENRLTISDGAIRLEKLPVWRKADQDQFLYSSSDGGFPVFVGRLETRQGVLVARLEIQSCDYCGQLRGDRKAWGVANHGVERQGEPKDYSILVSGQTLTLDKVTFHRVSKFPHE